MTLAFSALTAGVILFVTGVKGWSIQEFFSRDRPDSGGGFKGDPTAGVSGSVDASGPATGGVNDKGVLVGSSKLINIGLTAESQFGLHVGECDAPGAPKRWGPVHLVHVPNSFHYRHRAMDVSGNATSMRAFANWVDQTYPGVAELFWNGSGCVNRKNGARVPCGFVSGHTDHVHVAV